jgi:hypothetical protein
MINLNSKLSWGICRTFPGREAEMQPTRIHLVLLAALLLALAPGPGWAEPIQQPPMTSYMQSVVGTPDELSPLAPAEATDVKKVNGQWTCKINGQPMVYNPASSQWEPGPPEPQKK